MRILFCLIFLNFFFACAAAPLQPAGNHEVIKKFLEGTPFTHFKSACRVHTFEGQLAAFADGDACEIEPDGSHYIRRSDGLKFNDPSGKTIWENPVKYSHHQIFHSKVSGHFLAINNEFKVWTNLRTRIDMLLVLDQSGKIIKKFSFYDYFKKHPEILKQTSPVQTNWFFLGTGVEKNVHELTHVNSFIELTRAAPDGARKVTGYVSNCIYQGVFYVLDPDLTRIVAVVDLNGRTTHTVTQLGEDSLLFYRNATETSPFSSAEVYDLKENRFTTLYKSNNPYLSGVACGGVQQISPDKIALSHSQCVDYDNKADYAVAVEFVDLRNEKSFYNVLHKTSRHPNVFLIDGAKFVENNPKF